FFSSRRRLTRFSRDWSSDVCSSDLLGATLRVYVDDLEAAIPFYERLAGTAALRFERGGVQVAAVGCFLLMSGPRSQLDLLRKVAATIAVTDVEEAHKTLVELGADIRSEERRVGQGARGRCATGQAG